MVDIMCNPLIPYFRSQRASLFLIFLKKLPSRPNSLFLIFRGSSKVASLSSILSFHRATKNPLIPYFDDEPAEAPTLLFPLFLIFHIFELPGCFIQPRRVATKGPGLAIINYDGMMEDEPMQVPAELQAIIQIEDLASQATPFFSMRGVQISSKRVLEQFRSGIKDKALMEEYQVCAVHA